MREVLSVELVVVAWPAPAGLWQLLVVVVERRGWPGGRHHRCFWQLLGYNLVLPEPWAHMLPQACAVAG